CQGKAFRELLLHGLEAQATVGGRGPGVQRRISRLCPCHPGHSYRRSSVSATNLLMIYAGEDTGATAYISGR
ncbi:MAG TPA: hypothetical protein VKV79_07195, partial [Terriglobia bacterium]|nr:hypothetical protein [Terriglobia bacterium]